MWSCVQSMWLLRSLTSDNGNSRKYSSNLHTAVLVTKKWCQSQGNCCSFRPHTASVLVSEERRMWVNIFSAEEIRTSLEACTKLSLFQTQFLVRKSTRTRVEVGNFALLPRTSPTIQTFRTVMVELCTCTGILREGYVNRVKFTRPTLICTKGNTITVMLWLFAVNVVHQSQFNAELTLGNHATAMQPRVKSPLLQNKSSKMND